MTNRGTLLWEGDYITPNGGGGDTVNSSADISFMLKEAKAGCAGQLRRVTAGGNLRHAKYLGERTDKKPSAVRREA